MTGLLVAIVVASIVLMLVRPRGIAEGWWVAGGALLLVVLGLVPAGRAAKAVLDGRDVYFFLVGMMLLSELARVHGVFDWLAATAVRAARGSSTRLFALLYGTGVLVTVFMSNDATAVVLTPAVLVAVRHAGVKPLPHLFACALVANAASFVLPISNPANLVVYHGDMPSLGRWLATYALPSLLSIVVTFVVLRVWFRRELREPLGTSDAVPLRTSGKVVLGGLALVVGTLVLASSRRWDLGLPTLVASVVVALVVSALARKSPLPLVGKVSWTTLLLVAALFVLVEAVRSIGALDYTAAALRWAQTLPVPLGAGVVASTIAVANNILNNLPVGLVTGATLHATHAGGVLAGAAVLGVDLGPNLAVTGSLATILWLIALRREGVHVGFMDFLELGAVAMPAALLAALLGLSI